MLGSIAYSQDNRLELNNGKKIFASGMNLAWIDFGQDVIHLDFDKFEQALSELADAGGNTFRWWIHVNGSRSPRFDDGKVSGLNRNEISTLRNALDMACEKGICLILTLFSFDLLQEQDGVDLTRNQKLIEDRDYTQAYIDNALTPMVKALNNHSALLAWEVCNEPEGMSEKWGWTPRRVSMQSIQQFHNLIAGAIHQTAPDAKVCNGSWNIQSVANCGSFKNYYSDEALIAMGGDFLGILDFYQVHYYPRWYGEAYSPFHNPASHWQLDKPILIGEVQAKGLVDLGKGYRPKTTMTMEDAYVFAIENGYAGCLAWTWTGHDGFGNIHDAAPGLKQLKKEYPEDINIK